MHLAGVVGVDAQRARSKLESMDGEALAAIGMAAVPAVPSLPGVPSRALPARPTLATVLRRRLPLTPAAKAVLQTSSRGMRRGQPHPGPERVLEELFELPPHDPATELLGSLGVEPGIVRDRLARV
jgi:hypothetical protein